MKYISTRGGISAVNFSEAVMMGLATDGGLLLPEVIEQVDTETLDLWKGLSFPKLSFEVISRFVDDIPAEDLKDLIDRSYSTFTHPETVPIVKAGKIQIMELFHGPTLAFKDVALQFLGNVFEYLLKKSGGRMNILGATSGDTGSAAIYGVRGKDNINIFILHPYQRVSRIQELQMTTVTDANVFNIAVRGTFDDGQSIVKSIFNDIQFKQEFHLGAVNSINWARIVAQIVYYIYAALHLTDRNGPRVDFSVPTGNFGDIFAGYLARKMVPGIIGKLVLATNENDLLARFVNDGVYSVGRVVQTCSPSMDIQVASNFERYLYFLYDQDPERTKKTLEDFTSSGKIDFDAVLQKKIRDEFLAYRVSEEETIETIRTKYSQGYLLDPHTAVGVRAAENFIEKNVPMVCLATAHPAKFGDAVKKAIGREPDLPPSLSAILQKETRCQVLDARSSEIKEFLMKNAR